MSWERTEMPPGIAPRRLLPLRLKLVRFGNELKTSLSKVPSRFASDKWIWETEPASLQRMPVHEQRFVMLLWDHDVRDDDDKVFFHLSRASASDVAEDVSVNVNRKM